MVDTCREGCSQESASRKRQKANWTSAKTEDGTAEALRHPAPGESVLTKLLDA